MGDSDLTAECGLEMVRTEVDTSGQAMWSTVLGDRSVFSTVQTKTRKIINKTERAAIVFSLLFNFSNNL